jgi:NAD-dependent DNA ligase
MSKKSSSSIKIKTGRQLLKEADGDWFRWAKKADIPEVVRLLECLSKAYYNGDALVSDNVYDIVRDVLEDRDSSNPALDKVGAPISGENKVKLPYPMRSLDKIKTDAETMAKRIGKHKGKVVISDKLDGISALLHNGDEGVKLYTRGDGREGQDITHLLSSLVKKSVLKQLPDGATIRGELIMSDHDFKHFSSEFKNPRNLVAGLANSKTMDSKRKEILRYVHFVPYLVFNPLLRPTKQMNMLLEWGFEPVWYTVVDSSKVTVDYLSELLTKRKERCSYTIDGLVVVLDLVEAPVKVGNPLHSFAFKNMLAQEMAESEVLDVLWKMSKDGYLKPVILVKQVSLSGVDIDKATAFNAKWIYDNRIGPGARVKLIRSGDVIPYIVDVTKQAKRPKMPPGEWKWGESGTDAIGTGAKWKKELAIAQNVFFSETLSIKGLKEGVLSKLYDAGFKTIKSILLAKISDFEQVDRMGKQSAKNLRLALNQAIKRLTWERIMVASQCFGRGFGITRIRAALRTYPDVLSWKYKTEKIVKKMLLVDGFAEKTASQFAKGLKQFHTYMVDMRKILPKLAKPAAPKTGGIFSDTKIVFTGFRDKDLQEWVESEGGSIAGSVSSKTDLVVYRGESQSKVVKAQELGIKMLTYDEFIKKYKKN